MDNIDMIVNDNQLNPCSAENFEIVEKMEDAHLMKKHLAEMIGALQLI